jgi:hypothetical protein
MIVSESGYGFVRQMRGIRKLNRGNHNIGFYRLNGLGVASFASSHIGSSRIFFFNCREYGRGAPRCRVDLRLGEWSFFKQAGACGWQRLA